MRNQSGLREPVTEVGLLGVIKSGKLNSQGCRRITSDIS